MAPSNTTGTNNLQSIRSSCDRCRLHKLKCTVPPESDGSEPCERCARAKVPCVFGRRRRATRTSNEKMPPAQVKQTPTVSTTAAASMPSPSPTSASMSAVGCDLSTSSGSEPQSIETADTRPDAVAPWDSLMVGSLHESDEISGHPSNGNYSEWLHHGFGLDETYMFDASDSLDPAAWTPPPSLLPTLTVATGVPVTPGDSTEMGSWTPVQRLLSLIADIQQRLKTLEQGPWQNDYTRSMDDYPVGTILHLSQEFGVVAGPVLNRASVTIRTSIASRNQVADTSGQGEPRSHGHEATDASVGTVDTASTLLVLGGYMWLMRIYDIVLSHFQAHLSRVSHGGDTTSYQSGVIIGPNTSPTLQLGELPSTSTTPDLGRIHTAMCMLLGALREIEGQLGRGGSVARNLVVGLLTQEAIQGAGDLHDSCAGLGAKVQSVKELLRDRMGF